MDQAIMIDAKRVDFLMNRSQTYFDQGNHDMAISDLSQALEIEGEEENPQLFYKLGLVYYDYGKFRRCIKTLKKAVKSNPFLTYEADIYYHVGLSYCRLERFEESIFPYSKAVGLVPSDIRYIHERAKAYQMIGCHEEAIQDFSKVIKKNPKNAHAYFRRAFSQKALKNYAEAAEDFEEAKALDPLNQKLVVNYKLLQGIDCIVLCEPGEEKIYR